MVEMVHRWRRVVRGGAEIAIVCYATTFARPVFAQEPTPHFAGQVRIANWPAELGLPVEIVTFNAARQFKVCASGNVATVNLPLHSDVTGYSLALKDDRDCRNPNDRFDFYVNGVWAGNAQYSPTTYAGYYTFKDLNVPVTALATKPGIGLVWLAGQVTDRLGRPAPEGTMVTATAQGGGCAAQGSASTRNFYWSPKVAPPEPVGMNGFYVIGIPADAGCMDHPVSFDVRVAGSPNGQPMQVTSPPYGRVVMVPTLILPTPP